MEKIKVCTHMNEYHKTRYYQNFIIENEMPTDEYMGIKIKCIAPVRIDCEQGNNEIWDYDYYVITTQYYDNVEEDLITDDYYIAIKKEDLATKREEWLDLHATRIASIIYATCVMHTSNGNWSVNLKDLKGYSHYKDILNDTELHALIEDKLLGYEGVLDLERDGTDYDLIIGLAYFDYEGEEDYEK
jgi:hypothetical protein